MTDYREIFLLTGLPSAEPPTDLVNRVLQAIRLARVRQLRNRLILVATGLLTSFGYAALSVKALWEEIQTSSFFGFLHLAVSDPDIVAIHTKDFFLGLLEVLPFGTISLVGLGIFLSVLALALADAFRHARRVTVIHS